MQNFVIYLTFIPWFLYFTNTAKNFIKKTKEKKIDKKWLKNNFFNIFRFDNLILFSIFIFFAKFYKNANQIWLVKVLLFSAINLYLYINSYYDKNKIKNHIETRDISTILIILMISLIPIIYYSSTGKYTTTYYILFGYNFFNFIIVYISKTINDLIIKLVKRRNNED